MTEPEGTDESAREPGEDDDLDERITIGELLQAIGLGLRGPDGPPPRMSAHELRLRGPHWRLERLARRALAVAAEMEAEVTYNDDCAERQVELGRIGLAKDFRAIARQCREQAPRLRALAERLVAPAPKDPVSISALLAAATVETRACKLCGEPLHFVGPRKIPFGADGSRHEMTCKNRPKKPGTEER